VHTETYNNFEGASFESVSHFSSATTNSNTADDCLSLLTTEETGAEIHNQNHPTQEEGTSRPTTWNDSNNTSKNLNASIRQFFTPHRHREHHNRLYFVGLNSKKNKVGNDDFNCSSPATSHIGNNPSPTLRSHTFSGAGYRDGSGSANSGNHSPRSVSPRSRGHSPRKELLNWGGSCEDEWETMSNRVVLPLEADKDESLSANEKQALKIILDVRRSQKKGKDFEGKKLTRAEVNLLRSPFAVPIKLAPEIVGDSNQSKRGSTTTGSKNSPRKGNKVAPSLS